MWLAGLGVWLVLRRKSLGLSWLLSWLHLPGVRHSGWHHLWLSGLRIWLLAGVRNARGHGLLLAGVRHPGWHRLGLSWLGLSWLSLTRICNRVGLISRLHLIWRQRTARIYLRWIVGIRPRLRIRVKSGRRHYASVARPHLSGGCHLGRGLLIGRRSVLI